MAQNIRLKRSAVPGEAPTTGQLRLGEVAINTYDGKVYSKKDDGSEQTIEFAIQNNGYPVNFTSDVTFDQDAIVIGDMTTPLGNTSMNIFDQNLYTVNMLGEATNIDFGSSAGGSTFTINSEQVIFNSHDSIQIPVGTTAQRDSTPVTGQIRYNTQLSSFEGYGPGNAWGSLGGVKDVDQDTYIIPELSAGSDEDTLYFYTGGIQAGYWDATVLRANFDLSVGGDTNLDGDLQVDGNKNIDGNLDVTGDTNLKGDVNIGDSVGDAITIYGTANFKEEATFDKISTFTKGIDIPAGAGGLEIATGETFTFDGLAFSNVNKFTVKDAGGNILLGGWLLDTDTNSAN